MAELRLALNVFQARFKPGVAPGFAKPYFTVSAS